MDNPLAESRRLYEMTLRPERTVLLCAREKESDPARLLAQALACRKNGRLGKAGRLCLRILRQQPDHFDALHLLGLVRHEQGRHAEALELLASALKSNPRCADALSNRGLVLARVGRHEEALTAYDEALAILPDHATVLYNRGYPLLQLRRFEEALASYDRAIALKPDFAEAFDNRGNALQQLYRPEEALASHETALSLKPADSNILNNRGTVLHDLGRLDEALDSYDRALALKPAHADALSNRGLLLCEFRRFGEALASYDQAIALDRDHADAGFNKAICQLLQGDFAEGWRGYEQRWRRKGADPRRHAERPLWLGAEAPAGRTILLHAEQGLGDTIQFVRYSRLVKERGARVLLEVQPPLKALMATMPAAVEVIAQGEALPEFDWQCPLLSLPLVFGTDAETMPWPGAYLAAEEGRLRHWRKLLGQKTGPRIGIVWSGAAGHRKHRDRSIALQALGQLLDIPVEWLCLQQQILPGDRAVLPRFKRLRQFTEAIADFADTAALVAGCDLVISIDTAVAHLAGAMGKPVWVLLNDVPDWRWLLDRQDSPWYPSARLFRQQQPGDWSGVVRKICEELGASSLVPSDSRIDATRVLSEATAQRGNGQRRRQPLAQANLSSLPTLTRRFRDPAVELRGEDAADLSQLLDQAIAYQRNGRLGKAERLCSDILKARSDDFGALHFLGVIRLRQKRDAEALDLIGSALKQNPYSAAALSNHGTVLDRLGRHEEAVASYDRALALRPDYAEALNSRGNVLRKLGRLDDALASYEKALAIRPDYVVALNNRAIVLLESKRIEEALASCDRALAIRPNYAQVLNNRAIVLLELRRFEEALASCDHALAVRPDYVEALCNRGAALRELERFEEALASCDRALALTPDSAEALNNRGIFLLQLKRFEEALASCEGALAVRPDYPEALSNRGAVLVELKRFEEALTSCEQALAFTPDSAEALNNRGNALLGLKRPDHALADYDRVLALRPNYTQAHTNRGNVLRELKRFDEALASYGQALALRSDDVDALSGRGAAQRELKRFEEVLATYEQVLAIKPDHRYALGHLMDAALQICDWRRTAKLADDLAARIVERRSAAVPFTLLGTCDDTALHLQCARNFIADEIGVAPPPLWRGTAWRHERIRIAYLSADFHAHATAYLMAELFERHDRSRFEVVGVSFGGDDGGDMRARLVKAFDQFHDVRPMSDLEVARLMRDLEIDIAVDLKGYTRDSRARIFAHRPAPIQVSYLGYPGTMATEFIDYVIADPIVLPFDQQPFYTEKIVHLPECYQVNDSKRRIGARTPTRREAGLPEKGLVFCCFNNNYKITAPLFDVWMRLLGAAADSVLWLVGDNVAAERNLRKEAAARGIDPARLIFAGRLPLEDHLARHCLADLFLDTLPYNAHTTASDALWVGLPVLTCRGEAFAGRVAASLLTAVGLPELVTDSLEAYEELAMRLARDPALLGGLRAQLARNRLTHPLFDTDRFRRHIEAAYITMWETWQGGESPRSFSVEPYQGTADEGHDDKKIAPGSAVQTTLAMPVRADQEQPDLSRSLDRAIDLHQKSQLPEAERRFEEAVASYDRTLTIRPGDAVTLYNRGNALLELRRLDEALTSHEQAIALKPDYADAFNSRGCVLLELKRLDEALASYDRALAIRPDLAAAVYNRGIVLNELRRLDEALASFEKAIALKADYPEPFSMRGLVLTELGRLDEAIASYDQALAIRPDFADALNNRGNALRELKQLDEAVANYDRALAIRPDHPGALNNRGNVLLELRRPDEALASYDRALAIREDYADALSNRGNALKELGRPEEALASYDRALAIRPDYADAHNNRGNALLELKRFEEALAAYDRAVDLDPEDAEHRFNRSLLLLLLGSFGEGWREYEWRKRTKIWVRRTFEAPEWAGQNVSGKRVLLYGEQGFGDTIHFARFARSVSMSGAQVILEVQAALGGLLKRLDGKAIIVRKGEKLPEFDLHLPLMSVPFALGLTPEQSRAEASYLSVDPVRVDLWSNRLPGDGLRIGIAWQGNRLVPVDKGRSIPLKAFAPLSRIPGVTLISLQKGAGVEQLADLPPGMLVETLGADFDTGQEAFLDTAAVMMNLDLVVTCDTAVAHLAGALGRPVWIALKHVPDWRWMLDSESSPWYSTARLFRQTRPGDWNEVFTRVAAELSLLTARPQPQTTGRYDPKSAIELEDAEALYKRGNILKEWGRPEEALASYDRALAIEPEHVEVLNSRGIVLWELKHFVEALTSYDRALAIRADHAEVLNNRGNALWELERFDEALASYDRALAIRPHYPEALNNRGGALLKLQRLNEALASYDEALRIQPNYAEAAYSRGVIMRHLGRLEEAVESYDRALAIRPDYAEALNNRGTVLRDLERFEEAVASYDRALMVRPDDAVLLTNRANALRYVGRLDDALASADRALAIRPQFAVAVYNRGIVLKELRRVDEALASYERAIALKPDYAEAFCMRGIALAELGRLDEAIASYDSAAAIRQDYPDPLYNRGVILKQMGRLEEAVESYDRALGIRPDYAEALSNRGTALKQMGRLGEAVASYDRALAIRPDYPAALNNRGNALLALRRPDEALASYDRALAIRPDYAEALSNRGPALQELGRLDEALASLERALEIQPDGPDALDNRGGALLELKRFEEALTSYDRAFQLDPEHAEHRLNRSLLLLLLGFFDEGWREYEWRRRRKDWVERVFDVPEWRGENIPAKRVLLYSEQGLGDTIHFARFARLAATLSAQVILEVQPSLGALLQRLDGQAVIVQRGEQLPHFDVHLPLMSVPFVLGLTPDRSPTEAPYLSADPHRVDLWSSQLPTDGFRVGIAWQGNPSLPADKGRSIPLKAFAPLSRIPGVTLISLQKDDGIEQLADLPAGMVVETLGPDFDGGPDAFLDTAAVMTNLDLIVSCDTAVAHLAGALGRPVWIVLKDPPDWRWLLNREDTPWYSTARLFRQSRTGDWDEVFIRVAAELARLAEDPAARQILRQSDLSPPRPESAEALNDRGIALWELRRFDAALDSYDRALAIRPDYADALNNRGNALLGLKRFEMALESYQRALAIRPDYTDALANRGAALCELERFDEALASYDEALTIRPDHPEALFSRGVILKEMGRVEEAVESYDRALALRPDYVEALNNRGTALREMGRLEEAVASYDQALAVRPDDAVALTNRSNALRDLGRLDEALASADHALAIRPDYAHALANRGNVLKDLGRLQEALASYERVVELDPGGSEHRFNRSLLLLLLGSFGDGWREYEWRRRRKVWVKREFDRPEWKGEDISGKRVLLYSEQGLGDTIHFARFARSVAMSGAQVILEVQAPLGRLLQQLDGNAIIVRKGEQLPEFDLHLSLISVPFVLGLTLEQIPAEASYLSADPVRVDLWTSRLPAHRFKVGVAWQGNPKKPVDQGRSIPLKAFAPLSQVPGVTLISLQKGPGIEQLSDLPRGMAVETLGSDFDAGPDAFLDTAAVMMSLDLIITCDTAVAHLAGALGRPVWIVLKHVPDWRWMMEREDSSWYPTARLFRQSRAGDWDEVFTRIAAELAQFPESPQARPVSQLPDPRSLALTTQPDDPEALNNRGIALWELERFDAALASYDRALAVRPDYPEALNNRGNALLGLGRFEEALESYRQALAIRSDYAEALNNCGIALRELGRLGDALVSYERALAIRPDYPEALNNRGIAFKDLGQLEEALACFDRAIEFDPVHPEYRVNRSLLLLRLGYFVAGWREYEWRRRRKVWVKREFDRPEWKGEDISGKRVLLYSEQGLGDTIHFARFARSVAMSGAQVILEVQAPLGGLLQRLDSRAVIVRKGEKLPEFDLHLPLISVPSVLGLTPEQSPVRIPYLSADPVRVKLWSSRLSTRGFRVGIAWQGSPQLPIDQGRSIPLKAFAPLSRVPGVKLVSLQKGAGVEQLADLPAGMTVETVGTEFDAGPDAFVDTAAVIMNLDLIVTCDTAVAHLAGALGRPEWIVLKHVPDWRWMTDREDSPWYPTARLFRQSRAGDWDEVLARVAAALNPLAADARPALLVCGAEGEQIVRSAPAEPSSTKREPADLSQLIGQAIAHHQSGRLAEAERLYSQVLQAQPDHFDATHLLGVVRHQQHRDIEALDLIASALKGNPRSADALSNHGVVLARLGRHEEALASFDRALSIRPADPPALNNRGSALKELGRFDQALSSYDQALALRPDYAEALKNRSICLRALGRREGISAPERAISRPSLADGQVVFAWQISSYFAWGLFGLNLLLSWWKLQGPSLLTSVEFNESQLALNVFEKARLRPALEQSRALQAWLRNLGRDRFHAPVPVLDALGNDVRGGAGPVKLVGKPSLGVIVCETTEFSPQAHERAKAYELLVAGSTWNREILELAGLGPAVVVLQGIDPSHFHPGPRLGWFANRFTVFSGGKLEYRKGQDLVLLAFRAFAQRHPEALLVTLWSSPWPQFARSLEANPAIRPVCFRPDGKVDAEAWAVANGIQPEQVLDLGAVPNAELARLYREMDVALFPNRCEGGTNQVAMECMACGVPVVISGNTGHLDLIAADRCIPLQRQAAISGADHLGWGASDIEEIVEALETVWRDRAAARSFGSRGAEFMTRLTWDETARRLAEVLQRVC